MRRLVTLAALVLLAGCQHAGGEFTVHATASSSACDLTRTRIPAGTTVFVLANQLAAPADLVVLDDRGQPRGLVHAVAPGASAEAEFGLPGGDYQVQCRSGGQTVSSTALTVTGSRELAPPPKQTLPVTVTDTGIAGLERFRAAPGDRVAFTVTNAGSAPHGLKLTDPSGTALDPLAPLSPGGSGTLTVNLERAGTYTVGDPASALATTITVGR